MEEEKRSQQEITAEGNPASPTGEAGEQMLERMNRSHYELTGWGLSFLSFGGSERVLDIGCGGGMTLHRLSEKITTGHLTGLDHSTTSVAASMRLNLSDIADGRMDIVRGDVAALPFADQSFDRIVTVESFYFWPDPARNLKEVYRVLRRGGHFALISEIYGGQELDERVLENIERYRLFNPTLEEFSAMFRAAGFSEVCLHTVEGHSWVCVEGIRG